MDMLNHCKHVYAYNFFASIKTYEKQTEITLQYSVASFSFQYSVGFFVSLSRRKRIDSCRFVRS